MKINSREAFESSPFKSIKHSTYFAVYDHLLGPFFDKPITLVEVGVLGGGSLFMWRRIFGPHARIVGIDLNPDALRWEEHGFEILIGNQADPSFWESVADRIGSIDVFIDDGGHTYIQQISTVQGVLPMMRDGGILIVEDTHTSYMKGFGPKKFSFVKFSHKMTDALNRRFSSFARGTQQAHMVWSIEFYESFVAFRVHRQMASLASVSVVNSGQDTQAQDFRYKASQILELFDKLTLGRRLFRRSKVLTWIIGALRARLVELESGRSLLKKTFSEVDNF